MKKPPAQRAAKPVAKPVAKPAAKPVACKPRYSLKLYIAGATLRSQQAIVRAREMCEAELHGDYELEVIDIYQQPALARDGQILATPTLVKELPPPVRRFIGNLADTRAFFAALEVNTGAKASP